MSGGSFYFQLRDSPLHSRDASTNSNWNSNSNQALNQSSFSSRPYQASEFADSTRQLVPSGAGVHERRYDDPTWQPANSPTQASFAPSPTQQAFLHSPPESPRFPRPSSPGYHPGYSGPYQQTWPMESPLALPANAAQYPDSRFSAATAYKEESEASYSPPVVVHKMTGPPSGPPGGPPRDGGRTAWLQVLGGYFLFFNTWGLINAFGVFQTYYKTSLLPTYTNSTIAWIGTLTSFLLCASPITWGPIFDTGSPRLLVLFGSSSVVFGIMMTSLCTTYWQIMLAQGVCCGIGGGCLFITATSILPSYFTTKRALAMGLAASGSSLGGVIYPIMFTYTQPTLGFPWAVRLIGFVALATLAIPIIVIRPRARPPGRRKVFDTSILKEVPYELMNIATFFGFVGQYIPYFFIEQFASSHNLNLHFWMLIFLNIGSIPGRILPSLIADRYFHPLKVLTVTTAGATILAFCWIAIRHSTSGLIVWCFLYGFCSGAFVSLQGAAVASMTKDMRSIGTRFGINMFAGALGILIGSPVGGAIFPESWPGAQIFCGGTLGCATLAIVATDWAFQRTQRGGVGQKV